MKLEVVRLDSLFLALRGAGLVVGVEEMERCRHVLALWGRDGEAGNLAPERWRALFAAVLVKQPAQQKDFEHVFNLWCERAVFENAEALPPPPPPPRARPRFVTTLFGLLVLAFLVSQLKQQPLEVEPWQPRELSEDSLVGTSGNADPLAPQAQMMPRDAGSPTAAGATQDSAAAQAQTKVWLTVLPRDPERPWPGIKELLLGLFLLAWVGKVAADLEAKPLLPESRLPPRVEGPTRVLLSPPPGDLAILEKEEREAIVWGVGKYVSEEKTARLDLKATVKATAKAAGQLELRFEPKKGHREIWIWLDEAAADRQLRRVADEVEAALQRYGLPIERATFRGVPDVLYAADGRLFRPHEMEERRGNAQIAILSDGRLLSRRLEGRDSQKLEAAFRELGGWPRLSLFLPESAGAALRSLAARHQVEVRRPVELAAFLATSKEKGSGSRDVELWTAACALAPSAIDERSAEALRRELSLDVGPFCLADLRHDAEVALEGRLEWTGEKRQQRVEWLRLAELGEGRIFDRALDHWLGRYEGELAARRQDRAFVGTLAEAQLCAERALLKLLERGKKNAPGRSEGRSNAIAELFELFESVPALQDYLKKKLGELDTAESEAERLHLDFAWGDLTAVEQFQLIRMGFGGRSPGSRLRRPQRAATFLALGAGLAAGAFLWAFWPRPETVKQGVEVLDRTEGLASFQVVQQNEPGGSFRVELEVEGEEPRIFQVPPGLKVALEGRDAWSAEMVELPAGTFWMGWRDDDPDDPAQAFPELPEFLLDREKPAHQVTLQAFWIDKYEVMHEQYRRLKPQHRSTWDRELGADATSRLPVTDVDWQEAADFCAARGGRLPTEAEWEYAARADTRTPWSFGAEESILGDYAWYGENSEGRVREVGTKKPNPWGLYDLHGNILEWTASEGADYRPGAAMDPPPPRSVPLPVVRGGSFWDGAGWLRSAYRDRIGPGSRGRNLGFRCVRVSRPVPGLLSSRPLSSPDSASPPGARR